MLLASSGRLCANANAGILVVSAAVGLHCGAVAVACGGVRFLAVHLVQYCGVVVGGVCGEVVGVRGCVQSVVGCAAQTHVCARVLA